MEVVDLRVERRAPGDGLGIFASRPMLSWRTATDARDWWQRAYEIEAVDADTGVDVWRSGRVESDASHLVAWGGPDLGSRRRVRWRVRVEGRDASTATSDWAGFELGLIDPSDWTASFVVPESIVPADRDQPVAYLRAELDAPATIARARLHITSLGVHDVEVNGRRVGDHVLAPGWTSYDHRLRVETHDVTDLLHPGRNAVGVVLANGWYGEWFGFEAEHVKRMWGDELAVLAQLEIVGRDGTVLTFGTDDSWRSATGPIVTSTIYHGETYDARLERAGWSEPGFDDRDWVGVHAHEGTRGALVARIGPPVRRIETVAPVAITTSPSGTTIVDFGQNLVGWLHIRVEGPAGTTITMRHAEVLQDGELYTRPLRTAKATDTYTLKGDGVEDWEPRHTFHGFRYAELDGWPGALSADDVSAVVVHSDMARTGWFECSHELVNRLHDNVVWGMRGNFLDLPTDCPQRAERLGWTGDINVFAPTATFLFDVDGFLASWLQDLAADQRADGLVPMVVPDVLRFGTNGAVWADASVIVPWVLYERYGDIDVLGAQYPSMGSWVEHVIDKAGPTRLWNRNFQFGDWVDPASPPDEPIKARTDGHLVGQAAFVHSLDVLARVAHLLGRHDDAARYTTIGDEARVAFNAEYVTPNGRLASFAQTAYAIAIRWNLLSEALRPHAGDALAQLVHWERNRIGTGFVGTPVLCDALSETGHLDVAYALLEQTECPSWLYSVQQGATTIWERWDSLLPDGTVNPGDMVSFNHYSLGAVADWLHRVVAGLAPAAPGYREIEVRPQPGGSLTSARAEHVTPYGSASSAWRIDGEALVVDVVVLPNTRARVVLPSGEQVTVGSGVHSFVGARG